MVVAGRAVGPLPFITCGDTDREIRNKEYKGAHRRTIRADRGVLPLKKKKRPEETPNENIKALQGLEYMRTINADAVGTGGANP